MKKLALFVALLGLAVSVQANEIVSFTASCKTLSDNKEFLENRYNEYPLAGGPGVIRTVEGEFVQGVGKIYVDPTEKGFTFLIEFKQFGKSCVLLMGDEFGPIITGNPS